MNKSPIIILDDDKDDLELLKEMFEALQIENEIIVFNDAYKFLEFVRSAGTETFFTLCDLNMSPISGLELKKLIHDDEALRLKCVPFIFLSTSRGSDEIMKAYSFGAQGFFIKPTNIEEMQDMLLSIIKYWKYSQRPPIS
jgi:CheY-like chemotaxis protein